MSQKPNQAMVGQVKAKSTLFLGWLKPVQTAFRQVKDKIDLVDAWCGYWIPRGVYVFLLGVAALAGTVGFYKLYVLVAATPAAQGVLLLLGITAAAVKFARRINKDHHILSSSSAGRKA